MLFSVDVVQPAHAVLERALADFAVEAGGSSSDKDVSSSLPHPPLSSRGVFEETTIAFPTCIAIL